MEKWILNSVISPVEEGQVLYNKGDKYDKIFIVIQGSIFDHATGKLFEKGTIFNAEYIVNGFENDFIFKEKITVKEKGTISEILLGKFTTIMGGQSLNEAFLKNEKSHEKKMAVTDIAFRSVVEGLHLKDLIYIRKLGEGQFGHVFLTYSKANSEYYALKAISKQQIVDQNLEKHTIQERAVLSIVNFPIIIKMYRTFKDENFVYFLLSFIKGMELFEVIRQMDLLDNEQSRFYIGSLLLSIEYLHSLKIIYRDIKPENIMINDEGQLR